MGLLGSGCYASTADAPDDLEVSEVVGAYAQVAPEPRAVEECLATGFASVDGTRAADGRIEVWTNYPLLSPDYLLDAYGETIWVWADDEFDSRFTLTEWGAEGLVQAVFGRREGEETWHLLPYPGASCPPMPDGRDWPTP